MPVNFQADKSVMMMMMMMMITYCSLINNFRYSLSTKIITCDHNGKSTRGMPSCSSTAEPHTKKDHENISGLSLYQCKKTKKYKGLGPEKLPSSCYKIVLLYPTSL